MMAKRVLAGGSTRSSGQGSFIWLKVSVNNVGSHCHWRISVFCFLGKHVLYFSPLRNMSGIYKLACLIGSIFVCNEAPFRMGCAYAHPFTWTYPNSISNQRLLESLCFSEGFSCPINLSDTRFSCYLLFANCSCST